MYSKLKKLFDLFESAGHELYLLAGTNNKTQFAVNLERLEIAKLLANRGVNFYLNAHSVYVKEGLIKPYRIV